MSAEGLTDRLPICMSTSRKEVTTVNLMLLMCTVSYAGDVHNHMCW